MSENKKSFARKGLLASAATLALAGVIGFGAVGAGTSPVLAQAVNVQPAAQMPSFADVVQQVTPAVVSVQVKSNVQPASNDTPFSGPEGFDNLPEDHPLQRFFREFRGERGERGERNFRRDDRRGDGRRFDRRARPTSQGSGFFISDDGFLVTNNHVVRDGQEFTIVLNDGKEFTATLVGSDPRTDLAVLKVDGKGQKFTYVDFADDTATRVGDWVVAVGNPFGLGGTVTAGIVSARGRDIGAGPYDDFIQIDAAVNRGNSGGPAFNLNGKVVGINTAIFSPSGGNVGIAFAIPASTAKQVIADLRDNGSVKRGWLGVQIQPVTDEVAESLGLTSAKGALVSAPQVDSPGAKAGIKSGDVITTVNGTAIEGPRELSRMIAGLGPNTNADVVVWRDGKSETLKVMLGELPTDGQQATLNQPGPVEPGTLDDLGLTVTRNDKGAGLVVTDVDPDSPAAERGIQAGDVITSINSVEVKDTRDVTNAMKSASDAGRKSVLVQVQRDDNTRFVPLPITKG